LFEVFFYASFACVKAHQRRDSEMDASAQEPDLPCHAPLPPDAIRGLEYFNSGEYFEAHEFLEAAWRAEPGPVRELYRGVLQVAVGYFHLQRGNYAGAIKMFQRSRSWLTPFPDVCQGINLARLRQDMDRVESELIRLGEERIRHFDRTLLKPVEYQIQTEE
jgi:uncharacterized protein